MRFTEVYSLKIKTACALTEGEQPVQHRIRRCATQQHDSKTGDVLAHEVSTTATQSEFGLSAQYCEALLSEPSSGIAFRIERVYVKDSRVRVTTKSAGEFAPGARADTIQFATTAPITCNHGLQPH